MTPEDRKNKLVLIANRLHVAKKELEAIQPELTLKVDKHAIKKICTDLAWASENCTVVGLHQISHAMNDAMGITKDGKVV